MESVYLIVDGTRNPHQHSAGWPLGSKDVGKGGEEYTSIPLIRDPSIEDQHHTPVALGAYQAAEALPKPKDGLRKRVGTERVKTHGFEALEARLLNGLGRYTKGKSWNDH